MNKLKKIILAAALLFPNFVFCADNVTQPVPIGGGVDQSRSCPDVSDSRACDASNVIGDVYGSISKRLGSNPFIGQSISSYPINSAFWATIDRGTVTYSNLFVTSGYNIYRSSGLKNPVWSVLRRNLKTPNQHFTFCIIRNKVVMTGDALTDPIFAYDIATSSFSELIETGAGSSETMKLRAKYCLAPNNYLVLANIVDVTREFNNEVSTYYPSNLAYSLFQQPSSFTYNRIINIRTEDGEAITGITEKYGRIMIYKDTSISRITYTKLNLTQFGGDIVSEVVATGFGCIAPRSLVDFGPYDAFLSRDGYLRYDGNNKSRLNVLDEQSSLSLLIKPTIERIIRNKTYLNTHARYYPKRKWILLAYQDPLAFPSDRPNSVMVYDLNIGEWYPFKNWIPGCFTTLDGKNSDGSLLYGDAMDGKLYYADIDTALDDARKELIVDAMESTPTWVNGLINYTNVLEGTASVKIDLNATNSYVSSITKMAVFNLGDWNDKSKVDKNQDKLSFKVFISSPMIMENLRIDLQYGVTNSVFNNFFSSVTLTSAAFATSSATWNTIEIVLSSFPLPANWNDPAVELVPFSRNLTVYGIRFVADAALDCFVSFDDIRVVQGTNNPLNPFYLSKQFSINNFSAKDYRQIILTRERTSDSSLNLDIFTDFGNLSNRKTIDSDIPKEIFVLGYNGTNGMARLKSIDFSLIDSSVTASPNTRDYMNGIADKDFIYVYDKAADRMVKLNRNNYSVKIDSIGELGAGTTNFNSANQMCFADSGKKILLVDSINNRIKIYTTKDLKIVGVFGELGTGTTHFNLPTGITADKNFVWVGDDGNFRIVKMRIESSSFSYVEEYKIDSNTIGELTLQNDDKYVYAAYNKVEEQIYFQNVILERRNKGDGSIAQRVVIKPENDVSLSTFTLSGDFAILGPYIFIGFTKDLATTGRYFVQKLLRDNFALVSELEVADTQFSVIGDGFPFNPTTVTDKIDLNASDSVYLQLKYYDKSLENRFRIFNYAFALDQKSYQEGGK